MPVDPITGQWGAWLAQLFGNPKLSAGVFIIALLLFLAPESAREGLGAGKIRGLTGMIAVGAAVAFCVEVAPGLVQKLRKHRDGFKRLRELTPHEDFILSQYVNRRSRCIDFDATDGPVLSLQAAGILRHASNAAPLRQTPFLIEDWAWKYLNKHPGILNYWAGRNVGGEDKPPV